jgi:ABC-type polar amino acid transport system ATPase subunit
MRRHIFEACVCGRLGRKTRVLVTHEMGLTLEAADQVVVLGQVRDVTGLTVVMRMMRMMRMRTMMKKCWLWGARRACW